MSQVQTHRQKWIVFVDGSQHATVDAWTKEEAVEKVLFGDAIGRYFYEISAEPYESDQDPEGDYYPSRHYRG
jgi:hypothetical protein